LNKYAKYFETKGIKIVGIVSDRAKALVKLGSTAYLNVCSMPDLFHFMQDIGNLGGLQIGKKYKKACIEKSFLKQKREKLRDLEQDIIKSTDKIIEVYQEYRQETRSINQTIHPFNDLNEWTETATLKKNLLQSICKIGQLSEKLEINIDTAKATKVLHQIPDIVKGVENWVKSNHEKINGWVADKVITTVERVWFESLLLPTVYWELQLERTKNGRKNPKLVAYYQKRLEESKHSLFEYLQQEEILEVRQGVLFEMAYQMAKSFQRSSSQVEGRNGYLSFIHHGQKGIPTNKMKALTVIHNFDTKRNDGSTPAQRLFGQEFPDLFEFLCQNVTGFKEPRKRKAKPSNSNVFQR